MRIGCYGFVGIRGAAASLCLPLTVAMRLCEVHKEESSLRARLINFCAV